MIARKYETVVGIFVVASLIVLLVMVLIIARQEGLLQEYVEYRTVFRNVSGLKVGSEVRLAGVAVGNVTKISINPSGTIVVAFNVQKKYADRIRWDSQASIGFQGLLGEKSLDLTAGSPDKPPVPPEGFVASTEPLDITQLLAQAGPSLEDLQKVIKNLVAITEGLKKPEGDYGKIVTNVKDIVTKINQGKGTMGLLVNDAKLYKEATQTATAASKFMANINQSVFGTPQFKKEAQESVTKFRSTLEQANAAAGHVHEATEKLPGLLNKIDSFLNNLEKAGKGLPGLMTEGEAALSDADKAAKAAQKSWLLRSYVPKPKERTIRLDGDPGRD
jgi:phospholipid/cholesterol/gamma-HCH transport system substrate-binding protein